MMCEFCCVKVMYIYDKLEKKSDCMKIYRDEKTLYFQ